MSSLKPERAAFKVKVPNRALECRRRLGLTLLMERKEANNSTCIKFLKPVSIIVHNYLDHAKEERFGHAVPAAKLISGILWFGCKIVGIKILMS